MEHLREMKMHSLQKRISKRVNHVRWESSAQEDLERWVTAQQAFNYKSVKDKSYFLKKWSDIENNSVRKLSWAKNGHSASVIALTDLAARRSGVQWYFGTSPYFSRRRNKRKDGYARGLIEQLQVSLRKQKWTAEEKQEV